MLDLAGRRVVVVGDGDVARQRHALLAVTGAEVVTVPPLDPEAIADRLAHAWLVFAATGSDRLDAAIAAWCTDRGIWVNAHDQTRACTFQMPAQLHRGALTAAFGTGGAVPSLAVAVRNLLADLLPEDMVPLVEDAAAQRRAAKDRGLPAFSLPWDEILAPVMARIEQRLADHVAARSAAATDPPTERATDTA
jgi:siroheme synthase (precorrin-2 oxidase/ferrochelatase)